MGEVLALSAWLGLEADVWHTLRERAHERQRRALAFPSDVNRTNECNVESTLLTVARTGRYTSGLRKGFPVAPSIGLSVQF